MSFTVADEFGTSQGTVTITVDDPIIDSLEVSAPATADQGDTIALTVEAFDAWDHSLGDVTAGANFTLNGTATSANPRLVTVGPNVITATHASKSASTTVIVAANAAPQAEDADLSTPASTDLEFTLDATDAERDDLTYTVDSAVGGIGGDVACDADGECTYTPPAATGGEAIVSFTVADEFGSSTGTVTITVDAPIVGVVTITPSATSVDQGGSITIDVEGTDAFGNPLGDVTGDITLTSDVATDVIDGNTVRFPHASPHVITATHVSGATASILIEVIPTPAPATRDDAALPATGGPAAWILVLGLATLADGILLRRRTA